MPGKQSIHILQLPLLELRTYLSQQLEENPTLEALSQPERRDAVSDERIHNIIEQSERYKGATESIFIAGYGQEELQKKQDYRESLVTKGPTLQEHLLGQLRIQSVDEAHFKIGELLNRLEREGISEVILATNPTAEGETTASFLVKLLSEKNGDLKITRIALGVPMGGDLKYMDRMTLEHSIKSRMPINP